MKISKAKPEMHNQDINKSMPSQSGGNRSNTGDTADKEFNKNLTNEKKHGGKPPGDESIANRGKANAKKTK
jgi:hypothetical protein